ncbi:MAG: hypothetical protein GDA46_01280 [Bdellovibrionales bacterium]|nr:hypothetical protein [Bdellovibrionales bacterium]
MKYLLSFFLFFSLISKAENELDPKIRASYLKLLKKASHFHQALKNKNPESIQSQIKETQKIIVQIHQHSPQLKFQQRIHSYKLLSNLEEQLTSLKSQKEPQKKTVKKLFASFFELANVYSLNKYLKGNFFYCNQDRSLWLQRDSKVHNPINSNVRCGQAI